MRLLIRSRKKIFLLVRGGFARDYMVKLRATIIIDLTSDDENIVTLLAADAQRSENDIPDGAQILCYPSITKAGTCHSRSGFW